MSDDISGGLATAQRNIHAGSIANAEVANVRPYRVFGHTKTNDHYL